MAEFMKRKEKGHATSKKVQAVSIETSDPAFFKKYPALAEFLSLEAWDEQTARERGTLTLFWEEGCFKLAVNDRDSEQTTFLSKGTFLGVLESLEKGFKEDSLDWRAQKGKGAVKRK